jgi:hypothetical protein
MFKKKFELIQKRMELNLQEIRESLSHRGDRGSSAEGVVREFLSSYLPPYNRIGEGEIVDIKGSQTTQLDLIITNEYHPTLNDLSGPEMFIIEGVACVGEVKTKLNSQDIDTLIQSCITYKSLEPELPDGMTVHGNPSDIFRFVDHRPYFIFAFESQLIIETIEQKLRNYYAQNSTPIEHQIDAVFCLDRGTIWNFGDGKGSYQYKSSNVSLPGLHITNQTNDGVLFDLMSWISSVIPRYTYPKSPIQRYLAP